MWCPRSRRSPPRPPRRAAPGPGPRCCRRGASSSDGVSTASRTARPAARARVSKSVIGPPRARGRACGRARVGRRAGPTSPSRARSPATLRCRRSRDPRRSAARRPPAGAAGSAATARQNSASTGASSANGCGRADHRANARRSRPACRTWVAARFTTRPAGVGEGRGDVGPRPVGGEERVLGDVLGRCPVAGERVRQPDQPRACVTHEVVELVHGGRSLVDARQSPIDPSRLGPLVVSSNSGVMPLSIGERWRTRRPPHSIRNGCVS